MLLHSILLRNGARLAYRRTTLGLRQQSSTAVTGPGVLSKSALAKWYSVFGSTTAGYALWLVGGILAAEVITGAGTDIAWNAVNKGRTFESVDWTKFKSEDEDDDDDDEDEDEEDDEEGDGAGDDGDDDDDDDDDE